MIYDLCGVLVAIIIVGTLLLALHGILNFILVIVGVASVGFLAFIGWFIFGWCFCEAMDRITNWKD